MACATSCCGSLSRIPALCVSRHPRYIAEVWRDFGMPSRLEVVVESWAGVARGFERSESIVTNYLLFSISTLRLDLQDQIQRRRDN
jgi:hypothetical protein